MKTNYQCEKRKNILSILPLHRTFQVTEAKYSYYKKIHYYPCTAEESIIQRIKTEHRVSLTTASEFLCSVQHRHLHTEQILVVFWVSHTVNGKANTQINYVFSKK